MNSIRQIRPLFLLTAGAILLAGCSKEKALALKTAAEQARTQAVAAVQSVHDLFEQSVRLPQESRDSKTLKIKDDLTEAPVVTPAMLTEIMTSDEMTATATTGLNTEFAVLEQKYWTFAAMFRSLPEGNYLSAKAVKKTEVHADRLSVEFMNFAQTIGKNPVTFLGRRTLLLETIARAKTQPAAVREELLTRCANDAQQLRADELKARQTAVVQCLQAAESFRTTAGLIRDYDKLSISDVLSVTRNLLAVTTDLSGNRADLANLLNHYDGVEKTVRADPYWSAILTQTINP